MSKVIREPQRSTNSFNILIENQSFFPEINYKHEELNLFPLRSYYVFP